MEKDDLNSHAHVPANARHHTSASGQKGENNYAKDNLIEIPTINIPKGGGAIKASTKNSR